MDVSGLDECTQEAGRSSDGESVEAVQERGSESPAENEDGVDVASLSYSSSPEVPRCAFCKCAGYVVDVFPPRPGRAMWRVMNADSRAQGETR